MLHFDSHGAGAKVPFDRKHVQITGGTVMKATGPIEDRKLSDGSLAVFQSGGF